MLQVSGEGQAEAGRGAGAAWAQAPEPEVRGRGGWWEPRGVGDGQERGKLLWIVP